MTEEVPGEKARLFHEFDYFMYAQKIKFKRGFPPVKRRCIAFLKEIVAPLGVRHLINLVFEDALGVCRCLV